MGLVARPGLRGRYRTRRAMVSTARSGDAEFRAFPPGVEEADGALDRVREVNGAAIGDVNAEAEAGDGGEKAVGIRATS